MVKNRLAKTERVSFGKRLLILRLRLNRKPKRDKRLIYISMKNQVVRETLLPTKSAKSGHPLRICRFRVEPSVKGYTSVLGNLDNDQGDVVVPAALDGQINQILGCVLKVAVGKGVANLIGLKKIRQPI